jgi:hypothetical protein
MKSTKSFLWIISIGVCCLFVLNSEQILPSRPSTSPPIKADSPVWWNSNYNYRTPLLITNTHSLSLPEKYTITVELNTIDLIAAGKLQLCGDDLRIIWYDSSAQIWHELDRLNITNFNMINTQIMFQTQAEIALSSGNYYFYYGNPAAINPPTDANNVYYYFNDFNIPNGLLPNWQTNSGLWDVSMYQFREYGSANDGRILYDQENLKNLECGVQIMSQNSSFGAGIIFRQQNDNKYYAGGIGLLNNEVSLASGKKAVLTNIADNGNPATNLQTDTWYDLKIIAKDSNISIYVDNSLELTCIDTSNDKNAPCGLLTNSINPVYFEDFWIKLIHDLEPLAMCQAEEEYIMNVDEITNPLEMGEYVEISIEFYNESEILQTLIEYENENHSMIKENKKFKFKNWKPKKLGNNPYKIHVQYTTLNWVTLQENLVVKDTLMPIPENFTGTPNPIIQGNPFVIEIDALDSGSGLSDVKIQFNGLNYTMVALDSDTFQWEGFYPNETGTYNYTIFITDNAGNIITVQKSIYIVVDSTITTDTTSGTSTETTTNPTSSITNSSHSSSSSSTGSPSTSILSQNGYLIAAIFLVVGTSLIISRKRLHVSPGDSKSNYSRGKMVIIPMKVLMRHIRKIHPIVSLTSISPKSVESGKHLSSKTNLPTECIELEEIAQEAFDEGAYFESISCYKQIISKLELIKDKSNKKKYQAKLLSIQKIMEDRETDMLEWEKSVKDSQNENLPAAQRVILLHKLCDLAQKLKDQKGLQKYSQYLKDEQRKEELK